MILKNNFTGNNEHIYFIETNKYFTPPISNYNADPQTLYLLNSRYNTDFLLIAPKKFKITSEKAFAFFNIDIFKDTSKIITDLQYSNLDSFELLYYKYDQKVLSKFEQLYQGNRISIKQKELKLYTIFKNHLKIDCMPVLSKQDFNIKHKIYIQMEKNSFNDYIRKSAPRSFTISTKKADYKCNIFGILSSHVILAYLNNYPNEDSFYFDFEDENNEFSLICSLFNFEYVKITENNMNSLKTIAEELHINCILNDINDYFDKLDKISQIFDDHQDKVDSIEELFESLYNISKENFANIEDAILGSTWLKTEEQVQELAAFILQVIRTEYRSHRNLAELLLSLNQKAKSGNFLKKLVPFIVDKLMANFGKEAHECSFIYQLNKAGIISNDNIMNKLHEFHSKSDQNYLNVISWFMPEINQIVKIDSIQLDFPSIHQDWISSYFPSNLELYEKMRENCEPDDALTISLRHDDINQLQNILTLNTYNVAESFIPYNICEDFIENGKTNFINYAAAYGAVRCFKYLLLNHQKVNEQTFTYAIYGGNSEIIRIVYQILYRQLNSNNNDFNYDKKNIITTIQKHRNNLFIWVLEQFYLQNAEPDFFMDLVVNSAENGNAHSLIELIDMGLPFDTTNQQRTGWGYYQSRNMFKNAIESAAKNGFFTVAKILYDVIKEKNELFIIRNISPYTDFGNLLILKTIENSIQIQNKYGSNKDQDIEWFMNSIVNNNVNIINYYFDDYDSKLGYIQDKTIYQSLKYCLTANHTNLFKLLTTNLLQMDRKWLQKIYSEMMPNECKMGNFYLVSNIVNLISNRIEYDVTDSFLNAVISGSKQICDLLLNKRNLTIDFDELLIYIDEISKSQINIFSLIYQKSSNKTKRKYLHHLLHPAIKNNNIKLVEHLLKLNAKYDDALLQAVEAHSFELVDLILNNCNSPYFVNRISKDGTALCIATKNHDINIFNRLLSVQGIDLSLSDENGDTPLCIAIKNKDIDIAKTIIDFNIEKIQQKEIDKCVQQLFDHFSVNHDILLFSMVDFLIKKFVSIKDMNPNVIYKDNNSILFFAVENNDINFVKTLLQLDQINPNICTNDKQNTPLMLSISKTNIEIAELLINHPKTNINQQNYHNKTALVKAVKRNLYDVIAMLISSKKFNKRESNIKLAFSLSNKESLKLLFKIKSFNVNSSINHKTTKLIEATNNNDFEMIDLLINHSSFDKYKSKLENAFLIALKNGYDEIVMKFIPLLDDVNKYKLKNKDLLSIAQNFVNSEQIIKMIIENKSFDPNKFDLDGAIKIASKKNDSIILAILQSLDQIKQAKQVSNSSNENNNQTINSNKNNDKPNQTESNTNKMKRESNKTDQNSSKIKSKQTDTNSNKTKPNSNNQTSSKIRSTKSNTSNIKSESKQINLNSKSTKSDSNTSETKSIQSDSNSSKIKPKQTDINSNPNNQNSSKIKSKQSKSNTSNIKSESKQMNSNSNEAKSDSNKSEIKSIQSDSNSSKIKPKQTDSNSNHINQNSSKIKSKQSKSNTSNIKSESKQINSNSNETRSDSKTSVNESNQSNSNINKLKSNQSEMNSSKIKNTQSKPNTTKLESSKTKSQSDNSNQVKSTQKKIFKGIFNYLRNKSNNAIENELNITCSSCFSLSYFNPQNVVNYEDQNKSFWSEIRPNNWLCFEFRNNRLIPSNYIIRSCNLAKDRSHPRSWVIEGSNDNESWSIFDQVENCSYLNGPGLHHLFKIENPQKKPFKYIRMRVIDTDWYGTHSLMIESFEIFGTLVK